MPTQSWEDLLKESEKDDDFAPIPPGEYDFVVSKAEATISQKTGKQGWKTQNKVVNEGPHKGRIVFDQHYISPESPGALRIFFGKFKVLGLDSAYFATNPTPETIAGALVGKVFHGEVTIKPKDGQYDERNEIKKYSTPSEFAKHEALSVSTSQGNPNAAASAPVPGPVPNAAPAPAPAAQAPNPAAAPAPAPAPAQPDVAAQQAAPPPAPAPAPAPAPEPAAPAPAPAPAPADGALPPPPPPPQF